MTTNAIGEVGRVPPLSVPTKLAYGFGQSAEGLKNGAFSVFMFFFYNQVLGLSGTYTGLAIGIALVFDAVTDPLAGSLSDNWRSRIGRRHPFLYAAALPLAIAFFLLLSPPDLSEFGLFLWLTLFATLTRGAMTLYHVPHVALGAELSDDFHERTTVVAYRYFFSYIGVMAVFFIGFGIFFADSEQHPRGQFNVEAYSPFALTIGALMIVSILITALGTRKRIAYLSQPDGHTPALGFGGILARMFRELGEALSNRSFAWLFAGVLIVFMMVGVDGALNLHMNTFFWELDSSGNIVFFLAAPVGVLIGTPLVRKFNEWFDKKPCVIFGTCWWAACQIVPIVLRLLGYFPENGTEALLYTLVTIKFLQGVGVIQALVSFNSMIADIVDEHELRTSKRQEGIFFAAVSFSNKFTTGIGNVVGGLALDLIGWPRGAAVQAAADVPAETIVWLGLVYGPIVSGFAVVCVWCYSKYTLDRARHREIVVELASRRASPAAPAGTSAH